MNSGQLLIEINTYANPYPYIRQEINSFVAQYLKKINRNDFIEKYNLQHFSLNVLDKRQTMIEKLVSLFRFSFAENPSVSLAAKIRHFYDLYYLIKDEECATYMQTLKFKQDFNKLLAHDKQEFNTPEKWQDKEIIQSPLVTDFPLLWNTLRNVYVSELPKLAFVPVPDEKEIEEKFITIVKMVN